MASRRRWLSRLNRFEQVEQAAQVEAAQPEARVQVIRDRAYLGSADAPVVIEEFSDFL